MNDGTASPTLARANHDMDTPTLTALSLFSGGGGLDAGFAEFTRGIGVDCRVIAHVEREAYAAELLASQMDAGRLEPAPIWTDVASFDGVPFRGLVDAVIGGFPCQDLSVAGLRAGIDGERSGLWWQMLRIVGEVRPALVAIENVSGLLTDGPMDAVVGGLAGLGYVGQWGSLRASDVGCAHRRERVFVLAYRDKPRADACAATGAPRRAAGERGGIDVAYTGCERQQRRREPGELRGETPGATGEGNQRQRSRDATGAGVDALAHGHGRESERRGRLLDDEWAARGRDEGGAAQRAGEAVADGNRAERRQDGEHEQLRRERKQAASGSGCAGAGRYADLPFAPPGPDDRDAWRAILERWPELAPAVESDVRRAPHGMAHRLDRLRLLGNAVVPRQAAVALSELWRRLARSTSR